jgi:hypothetical protein
VSVFFVLIYPLVLEKDNFLAVCLSKLAAPASAVATPVVVAAAAAIATTVATAATAAISAAVAAATTTVATAALAPFLGFGFVDHQGPAIQFGIIQGSNSPLGIFFINHFHKAEAFGPTGIAISYDANGFNLTNLCKEVF